MKSSLAEIPTILGTAMDGGFYAGRIRIGDQVFALIVAPKADGEHKDAPWNDTYSTVEGAKSYFDGLANTEAMAGAGSELAKWVRGLRDQCAEVGVPFLFKQWGEWAPHQARAGGDEGGDLRRGHVRYLQGDGQEPDGHFRKGDAAVARIGKKAAGRLLDGVQHDGYPEVQP